LSAQIDAVKHDVRDVFGNGIGWEMSTGDDDLRLWMGFGDKEGRG
jgi:hypothetical protein